MVKISIIQFKPKLGDLKANSAKILEFYLKAEGEIVLFPELSLTGYLPKDLLLYLGFISNCHLELNYILPFIKDKICIIGMPFLQEGKLYNASVAMQNGKIIAKSTKSELPNYSIFDEKRYFTSGNPAIFGYKGVNFGLPICEDIWVDEVCQNLKSQGADVLLVLNASPFNYNKIKERTDIVNARFNKFNLPTVYCNQVLCQDGILYDGTSFVFDGKNTIYAPCFEEYVMEVQLNNGYFTGTSAILPSNEELLYKSLLFGLKEYIIQSGFSKVVVGFSGGADSALVLTLAVNALGKQNVKAVLMPSRFTSQESINDAKQLLLNTGVESVEISIETLLQTFTETLNLKGLAFENTQARIRGSILMAISNQENSLILTTGNKSEIATGYCTIYGDMCGAYNPIKDLYKTEVFKIMKYINKAGIVNIPGNIITKAPSAELRYNQKDTDSLPDYEILDKILFELIENKKLPQEITNFEAAVVNKVYNLILKSEYKRRQSAPGTKLSVQSFEPAEWRKNIL